MLSLDPLLTLSQARAYAHDSELAVAHMLLGYIDRYIDRYIHT